MEAYDEVTSQGDLDGLIDSIAGFHDSITKEIHLVDRAFVKADRSLVYPHRVDAQVLIQSQYEPTAVELVFVSVIQLIVADPGANWGAGGSYLPADSVGAPITISMAFDSNLKVSSERLFFRLRPHWHGKPARLTTEVPCPDAIPATHIESNWRQCSSCSDAWQEDPQHAYSTCPSCGNVTILHRQSS